jgi:hypothetical protein
MPTAIVMAHTERGFFIAADGRSRREDGGVVSIHSDREHKIFNLSDHRAGFAFAVTGTACFTRDDDDNDVIFNLNAAVPEIAANLGAETLPDAFAYCARLVEDVNQLLERSVTARTKSR